jgi:hypothetical protein
MPGRRDVDIVSEDVLVLGNVKLLHKGLVELTPGKGSAFERLELSETSTWRNTAIPCSSWEAVGLATE